MNEKLQYAQMLDMPVATSTITYKRIKTRKKRKKEDVDAVKREVIDKINGDCSACAHDSVEQSENLENKVKVKKKFKISVIGVQVAALLILVATIFLTNALIPNSGINSFVNGVFGKEEISDVRIYTDFTPEIKNGVFSDGKIVLSASSSAYSPCSGTVEEIILGEDNKYVVKITHSENFKTLFSGLDFVYCEQGDSVVPNVPVGYVLEDGASMSFAGENDAAIVNFTLNGNAVVWAV